MSYKFSIFVINVKTMEISEKIRLNKSIKSYTGTNSFIISLQKQLKSSKFLKKEMFNNKQVKVLSISQYEAVKTILE